jgi:hypothetical protein
MAEPAAHETILQTLDRWIVTPDGDRLFVPAEEFAKSVAEWDGIPLIRAQDHPDPRLFSNDPQAALDAVKGKDVGRLRSPSVEMDGSPRFMGRLDWGNDATTEDLWAKHRLSASIAYFSSGRDANGRVLGPLVPNHVLLFELSDKDLPKDPGVFILNKCGTDDQDEALGLIDRLKAMMMKRGTAGASSIVTAEKKDEDMSEEDKQKLALVSKELEEFKNKLASKDTEANVLSEAMKARDAEIVKLQGELNAFKVKAADEKWNAMKAKCPPGMVHGDAEKTTRALYEGDKDAFYEQLLAFKAKGATQKEGESFMQSGKAEDVNARMAKLGVTDIIIDGE